MFPFWLYVMYLVFVSFMCRPIVFAANSTLCKRFSASAMLRFSAPSNEYLFRDLKTSCGGIVELVRTEDIEGYVDINREYVRVRDIGYLNRLTKDINQNGLLSPIWMCANKMSGRAYTHDENHRFAACKRLKAECIAVYMKYKECLFTLGKEFRFPKLPRVFSVDQWLENPTPAQFGFQTRSLNQK